MKVCHLVSNENEPKGKLERAKKGGSKGENERVKTDDANNST